MVHFWRLLCARIRHCVWALACWILIESLRPVFIDDLGDPSRAQFSRSGITWDAVISIRWKELSRFSHATPDSRPSVCPSSLETPCYGLEQVLPGITGMRKCKRF